MMTKVRVFSVYSSYLISTSKDVPKENVPIGKPVFFGSALNDPVCLPATFKKNHNEFCANLTVRDYEAGHWVMLEAHEKVNRDLLAWIEGTASKL